MLCCPLFITVSRVSHGNSIIVDSLKLLLLLLEQFQFSWVLLHLIGQLVLVILDLQPGLVLYNI